MATKKPAAEKAPAAAKAAPAKDGKDAAAPDAPAPKKKGKKGLLIGLITAAALAASGGTAAWYFTAKSSAEGGDAEANADEQAAADRKAADKKAAAKKAPTFVSLEPFTVNLQDEEDAHYLQVAVVLAAADPAAVDGIKLHMPMIRNGILLLLSAKRSNELATLAGKQKLAEDIAAEAAKPLEAAGVSEAIAGVYFSSFVIQ